MKNILLLVTSFVKINNGVISEARYENVPGENTQTTNESAVRYLLEKFPLDKIFIFASKGVRGKLVGYLGADGKPRTHLEFFIERVKKFLPEVDDDFFECMDFDEEKSGNENLMDVADMAGRIQKFTAQAQGEEVVLHVDLTGGMRHINMMILELTRLLEYSGLKIGNVLYSNYKQDKSGKVEEVKNVYDLLQLIAGVEEFVNFGSVKALDIYYSDKRAKLSAPLAKLLDAMKNFAEAIKLCHYGQFTKAIQDLHDAVHDFDKNPSADVEDILMARLIGRIRENYRDLISIRDKDDRRIIRWCLDNDYLQQALTLYTERIPEYLGEKIIVLSEAEEKRLQKRCEDDEMGRTLYYRLLNLYSGKDHVENPCRKLCDAVKSETIGKKNVDVDAWFKRLGERLAQFNASVKDEPRLRSQIETFNTIRQDPTILKDLDAPELNPVREIISKLSAELTAAEEGYQRRKIIFNFVNHLLNEDFKKFFPGVVFAKNIQEKYPRTYKIYGLLFDKVFTVRIPEEKFLSIMEKYFLIQNERNHSNHARADFGEFTTAESLRTFMIDALDEIKNALPDQ